MKPSSRSSSAVTPERGHRGHGYLKRTETRTNSLRGLHSWARCDRDSGYEPFSLRQEVMVFPDGTSAWLRTRVAPGPHVGCKQIFTDRFTLLYRGPLVTSSWKLQHESNEITHCKCVCVAHTCTHTHLHTHAHTHAHTSLSTLDSATTIMSLSRNSLIFLHLTVGAQ